MTVAVFLDRDGVIVENRSDYVKTWEEVQFLPAVLEALRRASRSAYAIVLVTNQSAVGRGIISLDEATEINERVVATIEEHGGRVDAWYLCPHHPDAACACRKPAPGMVLRAAEELGIDLTNSWLVGDALTDMKAAHAAGVQPIMVLTGEGMKQAERGADDGGGEYLVVADLEMALDHILRVSESL
jgi:D-glycero-D-manno-heptose 1,7-bisphosphate phosphatase